MKRKLMVSFCVAVAILMGTGNAMANRSERGAAVVADAVVVRPLCFVATIVGSVFFVVSLPVAATSKSVHRTADALVVWPAQQTFSRPLGDLEALSD